MTIEQKPELNRYIDSTIPLTWAYRKRLFKILLPALVFMWVMAGEKVCLQMIVSNHYKPSSFPEALAALCGGLIVLTVFILGMLELGIRLQHRAKRKFQIREKGVAISPAKGRYVKWNRIAKFQFLPVTGSPNLAIFRLQATVPVRKPTRWIMVLDNPNQVRELVRELENKKLESRLEYQIEELKEPFKLESLPTVSLLGLFYSLGGYFCLLHATLFFAMWTGAHEAITSASKHTASNPFARFVASHFSSREQFADTLLTLSVLSGVAGVGLMFLGNRLAKQKLAAREQNGNQIHHP